MYLSNHIQCYVFYVLRFNIEVFKNPIIDNRYHAILALALALCYANTAVS